MTEKNGRPKMTERTVTVKCIGCDMTRVIRKGEIKPGEHPICQCGMPMIPIRAQRGQKEPR